MPENGIAAMNSAIIVRAPVAGIPVGQIEDDAGEETGLGDAEQEAQDVEHASAS